MKTKAILVVTVGLIAFWTYAKDGNQTWENLIPPIASPTIRTPRDSTDKVGVPEGIRSVNKIQTYRVNWWGTEGSERSRPIYGIIDIDNGRLHLRHAILEGRSLGDYKLPYWPIRSFVSFIAGGVELPHTSLFIFSTDSKTDTIPFRCGDAEHSHGWSGMKRIEEGFDIAQTDNADILMVSNRGSQSPILMEYFFFIPQQSPVINVLARGTNISQKRLQNVVLRTFYRQDFIWDRYATSKHPLSRPLENIHKTGEKIFAIFSSGTACGYQFQCVQNCQLSFSLSDTLNSWQVGIANVPVELNPNQSVSYQYLFTVDEKPHLEAMAAHPFAEQTLATIHFHQLKPEQTRTAPVIQNDQVTIGDVFANLQKHRVRGLNLLGDSSQLLHDLDTLKNWGCNLVIVNNMEPEKAKQIIARGHELGMEMFLTGKGSYLHGLPDFDDFFAADPDPNQLPEAYGLDEDHYYWYGVKPILDYRTAMGKPLAGATIADEVCYWSRCFVDKWRHVLAGIRSHHPAGRIWFYTPTPSIAHVDPLDYYPQFFQQVSQLGADLTVFPFYYGIDYHQVEYMVRRWKDAGVHRVVFLPMRGFMSKPSQFMRAITAARRGQADGACGYAFPVGQEKSNQRWQWQSVLLAAQANFPTPDLDAYCFIEEPAELVEALASSNIIVVSRTYDSSQLVRKLDKLLPGQVRKIESLDKHRHHGKEIYIEIGENQFLNGNSYASYIEIEKLGPRKGLLSMFDGIVQITGTDEVGIENARKLLLRFAALAGAEATN